jgi:general secretion pathway protein M
MKDWLAQLDRRERRTLFAGAVALVVLGFYFLLWQPHLNARDTLLETARKQRAALAWMEQAAVEVVALRQGAGSSGRRPKGRSLMGVVDSSARAAALSQSITRLEPQGDDQVRLTLTHAQFDKVADWLSVLQQQQGIRVATLNLERDKDPGYVAGRVVLGYPEGP